MFQRSTLAYSYLMFIIRKVRSTNERLYRLSGKAKKQLVQQAVRLIHNKSPQQVVKQTARRTTSWITCRTASPQLIEVVESEPYHAIALKVKNETLIKTGGRTHSGYKILCEDGRLLCAPNILTVDLLA